MTVAALGEEMSASELVQWSAFFELEAEDAKRRKPEET